MTSEDQDLDEQYLHCPFCPSTVGVSDEDPDASFGVILGHIRCRHHDEDQSPEGAVAQDRGEGPVMWLSEDRWLSVAAAPGDSVVFEVAVLDEDLGVIATARTPDGRVFTGADAGPVEPFFVGDYDTGHLPGDLRCPQCWGGYPVPCEGDGCVGLVHAEFGDYSSYDSYWLETKCDRCGEPE